MKPLQKSALKYFLLPGILPRTSMLFQSGFTHVSFLIATIYGMVGLLPYNHPYLNPQNRGRFGIRNVLSQAANNLVISWKTADQVVVYFTILIGMFLLAAQFMLLIIALVGQQPAAAAFFSATDLFLTSSQYNPGPAQDLAFIIMDRVFGVQGIFNSCISDFDEICTTISGDPLPTPETYPFPFHLAIHTMLAFYSYGIFIIAIFLILYFVAAIVSETAMTGTPFGQRVNKAWTPIRIIVFGAMLVPLNIQGSTDSPQIISGLNTAQLATLWTAKFGSNFATNAWGYFNAVIKDPSQGRAGGLSANTTSTGSDDRTIMGPKQSLIATPKTPELRNIIQFMFIAKTCKIAEEWAYKDKNNEGRDVQAYLIREGQNIPPNPVLPVVLGDNAIEFLTTDYGTALAFSNYGNITIRFGHRDKDHPKYKDSKGNVYPHCGDIMITTTDTSESMGSFKVQQLYYDMIKAIWEDNIPDVQMTPYAACLVQRTVQEAQENDCTHILNKEFGHQTVIAFQNYLDERIRPFIEEQIANGDWDITANLTKKGWAGAALWYNKISELNGQIASAYYSLPQPLSFPYLMEDIADQRRKKLEGMNPSDLFKQKLPDGGKINYPRGPKDKEIASAMIVAQNFWENEEMYKTNFEKSEGNFFIDAVNALFGTSGIFDMRANVDIHPLAQLSALGRSMLEASVRNFAFGMVGGSLTDIFGNSQGFLTQLSSTVTEFLKSIGLATLAMSFIMAYILPLMPFIYFIFAVSGWVKSIFEAIVAMPLWAMAHVRIEGEGLPGADASNGYYLLLEIFLRPILILFGMLASITIFSALVSTLNRVFDLVVQNVGGYSMVDDGTHTMMQQLTFMRGPIDEFFLTTIYVILCYMIGTAAFKLIDAIPNQILRWAGVSVQTFQEGAGDPAGELSGKMYKGIGMLAGQFKGGSLAAIAG